MAQPLIKKDDDRDVKAEYSPFFGIEKGAVLQEARVFNDPQLDPRRCSQVITKLLYLLNQGDTFTKYQWSPIYDVAAILTSIQVLDLTVYPRIEFDLPIVCANIFTTPATSIIVLDLNPLHDVITNREYMEKYYKQLVYLGIKYAEIMPWGGKHTAESFRFFSLIVLWTRFTPIEENSDILFAAFKDYYKSTFLDYFPEYKLEDGTVNEKGDQGADQSEDMFIIEASQDSLSFL